MSSGRCVGPCSPYEDGHVDDCHLAPLQVTDKSAGYSTSCLSWVGVGDGEQLPAGADSTISCTAPGCLPQTTSTLPGAVVAGFPPVIQNQPLYWTQYYMKITCDLTSPQVGESLGEVPPPYCGDLGLAKFSQV